MPLSSQTVPKQKSRKLKGGFRDFKVLKVVKGIKDKKSPFTERGT